MLDLVGLDSDLVPARRRLLDRHGQRTSWPRAGRRPRAGPARRAHRRAGPDGPDRCSTSSAACPPSGRRSCSPPRPSRRRPAGLATRGDDRRRAAGGGRPHDRLVQRTGILRVEVAAVPTLSSCALRRSSSSGSHRSTPTSSTSTPPSTARTRRHGRDLVADLGPRAHALSEPPPLPRRALRRGPAMSQAKRQPRTSVPALGGAVDDRAIGGTGGQPGRSCGDGRWGAAAPAAAGPRPVLAPEGAPHGRSWPWSPSPPRSTWVSATSPATPRVGRSASSSSPSGSTSGCPLRSVAASAPDAICPDRHDRVLPLTSPARSPVTTTYWRGRRHLLPGFEFSFLAPGGSRGSLRDGGVRPMSGTTSASCGRCRWPVPCWRSSTP